MSAEQDEITHQDPLFLLSIQNIPDSSDKLDQQLGQQITALGEEIQTIEALEPDKQSSVDDVVSMAEKTGRLLRLGLIRELLDNLKAVGKESLIERAQLFAEFAKRGFMPDAVAAHVAHFFARLYPPPESALPQEKVVFQPEEPLQKKPPQKRKGLIDREDLALEADALLLAHMDDADYISYDKLIQPFLKGGVVQKHHRKIVVQAESYLTELAEHREVALDIFRAQRGEMKKSGYRYIESSTDTENEGASDEINHKENRLSARFLRNARRVYNNFSQVVNRKDHKPIPPEQRMAYEVALNFLAMYELTVEDWINAGESISVPYKSERSYTFSEIAYVIGCLLTPKAKEPEESAKTEAASAFSQFKLWLQKRVEKIRPARSKSRKPEDIDSDYDIPPDEDPYEYLDEDIDE